LKTRHLFNVIILIVVAFIFNIEATLAQSYQFSKYSIEQGLPQQYVYSLNQDNKGFIWIGTGDGISKFDGIDFENFTTEDGLAENFVTCSAQRQKNIIWLGHNKGGISRIVNNKITTVVSDSLVGSKITDIIIDQDNYIWATAQNGYLIRISPKLEVEKFDIFANQKNIYSITGKIEGNLLIGTDEGLFLWSLDTKLAPSTFTEIKSLTLKKIECITPSKYLKNNYWIGTAESGLYQLKFTQNSENKSRHYDDININSSGIQHIEEDDEQNLWISSYNGLYKLIYDKKEEGYTNTIHFGEKNGIGNFIKTTLIDREGNSWIGMYGEGLAMLKDEIFTFYNNSKDESIPNDTRSFLFRDSTKWYGLSEGLLRVNSDGSKKYYNASSGFKNIPVTTILKRGEELFLGTDGGGLFRFNIKKERFTKESISASNLSNNINKMVGHINDLWIATEDGLVKKNLVTKKTEVYNTLKGLRHNSIYDLLITRDVEIIIGSHSNELTIIKDGEITHQYIADLDQLMDIIAIEKDGNERLWIATLGNGVFKQEADSFIQISTADGLKSDYCYSIVSDNKNGIWVTHRGGLSRISKDNLAVQIFDSKKGINVDFNKGATYVDEDQNVWFGSSEKTVKFNPKKFLKNTTPPIVSVKSITVSDKKIQVSELIDLPYNRYKLKIDFIGISFKQPEGVKYQYFLEGYDLDWSESTFNNFANYSRLDDGTYTFYVKACNNDGFCSEETKAFTITIAAPFWKKWWFLFSVFIALILLVYFIIIIRERRQKEIQKNLEIELDKRTKEVVKKSEEIEEKNINITDSINYALKIQKSILPSKELMKEYFPESFVFYQPRDIVSGDFYWYEKVENKFIVVCADCTGHGVPGAFMSMITSTLFKEIAHQHKITEPSKFLYKLDLLLKNTLKQSDRSKIHDGLDMSICVFDTETNLLNFSGAYRPLILYRNNELELIKTTPFSIGGADYVEKEFETNTVQLTPGDSIYLFTDGFPDQFGGEKGKKLYLKGFKTLIENSVDINMNEQHLLFKRFFKDWKGDLKQIDDVLVMGIKIV
jgi:ligand-binding sensor domain-containing protein/serine phosphatase RsbU (regulator of sigma subunit)